MSTAENKGFAYRILEEIFSQGNLSNMEELFSPEMVIHDPDKELRGLEQVKQGIMRLRMAFPDLHYIAKDMTYTGIMILRFVEKKAVEYWAVSDALGIYRQLGVILPSARSS